MTDSSGTGSPGQFPDPTAPLWPAAPTQPLPASEPADAVRYPEPAPPTQAYGQAPYPPAPYVPSSHEAAPYGQVPYGQAPYGQPPYGQAPYGQAPYGQAPHGQPPYGQAPYGAPAPYGPTQTNGSALALTIVTGVASAMCCLLFVPSLIFGIVALSRQSTDPAGSARMTRYGWVAAGITVAVAVLGVVAYFVFAATTSGGSSVDYGI